MSEMKWYVLKTISGQESKVKMYIENEVLRAEHLKNNFGQIVVPTEKVVQIRNGKKIRKDKVYYPGYVMIEANLIGELPHTIKNIPGVISFLSATKGGDPLPMRKSEVSRIFGKMDELSESEDVLNIPFENGETVKVIDGPFNGFNGTIEKINEEKRKLDVMVLIFGRKTPIELSFSQVEKI
ncbi:transcription termination/antitermination protein NusG [Apibacter adventoris]|uniref:Transcription termination/antitermination protein NusG n=1 Tax=Apibacter adventoris TaxID=1679466 RepID=A0A0H4Q2Q9_9FLAO|nr:transcription termination/antitermination protein NusG [Apibacter adventoris]AKP61331.1 transcription antitermination protein NusG [Apibacter adventoris]AKP61332.1 transcription antitermination protein NusG [Apibacter adventoris]PQL93849.1 transcription termination/antitermination factor NusG [Apibacter adventoris]PQL95276.1 transcription termination/antitermination factor NusG [Apibacter adventoris]